MGDLALVECMTAFTTYRCPYLDAFPALRSQAVRDNRRLYISNDEHLDVMGHQVIAQLLLEWLRVTLPSAS
jgi:hypothetical protein